MALKYRLGLDVGTNSLGWSVLALDGKGQPCRIEAAGARIFSEGRDPKSKATLAATRRAARSARRRRDRFKQRQRYLLAELAKMGLFPESKEERKALQLLNPLELRARALAEPLAPYEVGRALFHLNQRRGFKSNRKDRSEEVTNGKVSSSYRLLLHEMGLIDEPLSGEAYKALSKDERKAARQQEATDKLQALDNLDERRDLTYGAFLWRRQQDGKATRARPGAGDDGKLYDVYPTRELYEDEFRKIWSAQASHHPELMTDERRDRVRDVIFSQRPLRPQDRGRCTYMKDLERAFRALPSFQLYRIYQEVNNLEWTDAAGRRCRLVDPEAQAARDEIIDLLKRPTTQKAQLPFSKMKAVLKRRGLAEGDFTLNFELPKRAGLDGDKTAAVMQQEDHIGPEWHGWSLDRQDEFIGLLLDAKKTDEQVLGELTGQYGLDEVKADTCLNARLEERTANVSDRAARLMLEAMRDGIEQGSKRVLPIQSQAASYLASREPGFVDPMRQPKSGEAGWQPAPSLLYYGEAFQDGRHIIPGSGEPKDEGDDLKFFGGVTNPTVHIALNQIRQVVNELIARYGHPASIAIELARDLPVGAQGRRDIEQEQKANQDRNEALDSQLREMKQLVNRDNRTRLRLWEELSADPNGRCCPFTGKKIGLAALFSDQVEVEHLIPFSQSLDDSYANKVVCSRQANRDKGQRTPYEAFHDSPEGYDWERILQRVNVKELRSKLWRFGKDAREIWQRDHSDFSARHLNDTRYIGRLTREYLEGVCHIDKIDVLTGRLTALLRGHWGLNGILSNEEDGYKSRDDHRHHAVDAIVIGVTSRAMLQKVATAANRAEEQHLERLFEDGRQIDPWEGFRSNVRDIVGSVVVSHKPSRKRLARGATDGQLHKETAYGIVSGLDQEGPCEVVVRKPVAEFKKSADVEAIRDAHLRERFKAAFEKKGEEGVKELAARLGIRRLRRTKTLSVIQVRGRDGTPYKAYAGDSNWGIEIYALPASHKKAGQWQGQVISRFDANRPGFKPGQTKRPHPAARLVMRLQINDAIQVEKDGQRQIYRLQKMQRDGRMSFAPLSEANVDARVRAKEMEYFVKNARGLMALNARKVHISPSGQVSLENRTGKAG